MKKYYYIYAIVIIPLLIIHLVILAQIASVGYKNDEMKKKLNEIRNKNRSLSVIEAEQGSLKRIEKIARDEMNMTAPEKVVFLKASRESSPADR